MPHALGQAFAAGIGQQIVMGKLRHGRAEQFEQLDLYGRIGDVILAADDMGHRHIDIIDDRRQRVEIGAIGAHQHRIGQRGAIDMAFAAHQIAPRHHAMIELEPPMRLAPLGLECGNLVGRQGQCRAVVDRGKPARRLPLAATVQLVLGFIAGVKPAQSLQLFSRRCIERKTLRLARHLVGMDAQPVQINLDGIGIFLPRAFLIGIVEPQHKSTAAMLGKQPVHQSRAGIADMDAPRGRRSKANFWGHVISITLAAELLLRKA